MESGKAVVTGPDTWSVQGRTIQLPVVIPAARAAAALFAAPAGGARHLLAGTGLVPVTVAGRAAGVLLLASYDEFALGSYDEVGVGVLARGPGRRLGLHLVDLPVTGSLTCAAGRDIWALPKWLMTGAVTFSERAAALSVVGGGTPAVAGVVPARGLRVPVPLRVTGPVWCLLDRGQRAGELLRGAVSLRLSGLRVGRGQARLELGPHPMAARMRALGMARRPMLTVHVRHLSGEIGSFRTTRLVATPADGDGGSDG